jgi:hypothetical protein
MQHQIQYLSAVHALMAHWDHEVIGANMDGKSVVLSDIFFWRRKQDLPVVRGQRCNESPMLIMAEVIFSPARP